MNVIGLGGPAGTGKSTVARLISARDGVAWIDLDRVAWRCYAPGKAACGELIARFGRSITDPSGRIDRRKLAATVFESDQARADLNAIVHPEVETALRAELDEHRSRGTRLLLVEGALLGISPHIDYGVFDKVLWLTAPRSVRRQRLEGAKRGEHADRVVEEEGFATPVTQIEASGTIEDVARLVWQAICDGPPTQGSSRAASSRSS